MQLVVHRGMIQYHDLLFALAWRVMGVRFDSSVRNQVVERVLETLGKRGMASVKHPMGALLRARRRKAKMNQQANAYQGRKKTPSPLRMAFGAALKKDADDKHAKFKSMLNVVRRGSLAGIGDSKEDRTARLLAEFESNKNETLVRVASTSPQPTVPYMLAQSLFGTTIINWTCPMPPAGCLSCLACADLPCCLRLALWPIATRFSQYICAPRTTYTVW